LSFLSVWGGFRKVWMWCWWSLFVYLDILVCLLLCWFDLIFLVVMSL
jgi:hypothetical protein